MPRRKTGKKLIVVPEELTEELMPLAKQSGLTLQELVTLILSYAVRSLRGKENIRTLFQDMVLLYDINRLGAMPVPQKGLKTIVESIDERVFDEFLSYMNYIASIAATSARVRGFYNGSPRDVIQILIPEATIEDHSDGDEQRLIIGLREPAGERFRRLIAEIVNVVLEGYGYRVEREESLGPILVFRYTRSGEQAGRGH